jgi:preprotein translocase subunit SecB
MEKGIVSLFHFDGHRIVKSFFEMKDGQEGKELSIGFLPKGVINKEKSTFELELSTKVEDENSVFIAEFTTIGMFSFNSNEIAPDTLDKMFYLNAPAILFPYVRAYLSTLTTLSGLKPVILPTMNLSNLASDLQANTTIK